jgi:hypothetical protein
MLSQQGFSPLEDFQLLEVVLMLRMAHSSVSIQILLRCFTKNHNGIENQELMSSPGVGYCHLPKCVIMGVLAQVAGLPLDPWQPIR